QVGDPIEDGDRVSAEDALEEHLPRGADRHGGRLPGQDLFDGIWMAEDHDRRRADGPAGEAVAVDACGLGKAAPGVAYVTEAAEPPGDNRAWWQRGTVDSLECGGGGGHRRSPFGSGGPCSARALRPLRPAPLLPRRGARPSKMIDWNTGMICS